ncbi:MAG: fibrobacter succinogenes major paralogous domain-containing protein [Bacteroidota bacterium]
MKKLILIIIIACAFICNAYSVDNSSNIKSVKIGNQVWMKGNLDVDHYRNGDAIPEVKDPAKWKTLTTGAWCYFKNNRGTVGKLYNFYAVNDQRGLAPTGWHITSADDWEALTNYFGGDEWQIVIKQKPLIAKETGFFEVGGGLRNSMSSADFISGSDGFWSVNNANSPNVMIRRLQSNKVNFTKTNCAKVDGYYVRCIKD